MVIKFSVTNVGKLSELRRKKFRNSKLEKIWTAGRLRVSFKNRKVENITV